MLTTNRDIDFAYALLSELHQISEELKRSNDLKEQEMKTKEKKKSEGE